MQQNESVANNNRTGSEPADISQEPFFMMHGFFR
jgi:hypothetical protein